MYKEHMPEENDMVQEKLVEINQDVSDLTRDAQKSMYTADTLSLAHDIAQLGNLYKAISKNEHAKKMEKTLHLKNQNTIGASIVSEYMAGNMAIHSGVTKDQVNLIERVWGSKKIPNDVGFWNQFWIKCLNLSTTDRQMIAFFSVF